MATERENVSKGGLEESNKRKEVPKNKMFHKK
jgi:hypothetical protein